MVMSDLVERLRRRTLVHHGGESKYGWNLAEGDSELHVEAATEIEALRATLAAAQIHRDMAVSLLAEWCVDVDQNGTVWDDWDENYKAAMYRPGPLRELLDKAIEDVRYARRYEL